MSTGAPTMKFQFAHIEGYGRRASALKKDGRSMEGVAFEAERRPTHCEHVSDPKPPQILYGCQPSEAVRIASERAEQAIDADGNKLRIDGLVFLGGVASYPVKWNKVRTNKAEEERLQNWLAYMLEFLKQLYGVTLHYVLLHVDEPHPHLHWGCVPELEADGRMRFSDLHPGRAAYDRVFAATRNNQAGRQAFRQAMKKWQDALHHAVYAKVGFGRVGPRRQRLTPSEYKARKEAEAALARTLAAEQELKAQWRKEIRAQISEEFSEGLIRWKHHCSSLTVQLAAANKEITALQARLSELEDQLHPPGATTP